MRRKKLALVTLVLTLGGTGLTAPPALAVDAPPDPGPGNSRALENLPAKGRANARAVQALRDAIARQG
jgi:hypothetical protein